MGADARVLFADPNRLIERISRVRRIQESWPRGVTFPQDSKQTERTRSEAVNSELWMADRSEPADC
jgi:hypothetical protein